MQRGHRDAATRGNFANGERITGSQRVVFLIFEGAFHGGGKLVTDDAPS
ncbi:hypothetical protein [Cupriavidus sp. UBA2526]|nr:hypothetical protein [Cupriavidus sp. UBA2526]